MKGENITFITSDNNNDIQTASKFLKQASCLSEICDWIEKKKKNWICINSLLFKRKSGLVLVMTNNDGCRKIKERVDFSMSVHTYWEECSRVPVRTRCQSDIRS